MNWRFSTWHPLGTRVLETRVISRPFKHRFVFFENDVVDPRGSHLETESLRHDFIKAFFKIKQSQTLHSHASLTHPLNSHTETLSTLTPLSLALSTLTQSPLSRTSTLTTFSSSLRCAFLFLKPLLKYIFFALALVVFLSVIFSCGFFCVYLLLKCCLFVCFF